MSEHTNNRGQSDAYDKPTNAAHNSNLRIHFLRHGETEWTLTGQHTGLSDIPLTTHGEAEVSELGERIRGITFSLVLTSPLKRARQTCDLAGLGNNAEVEPDLAEWNYGDYDGMRSVDIAEQRQGWNLFRDGCPGGESPQEVSDRADRLIARLRLLDGNVALVSHGQFGGAFAARWLGLPVADGQHFALGTASHSILGYETHHPDETVVILWNGVGRNVDVERMASVQGVHTLHIGNT